MPATYQGQCSACGYESPIISDALYYGVIVDDPSTIEDYAMHPDCERVAVLAHPLEMEIMEAHGFTYASATFQGRLLRLKRYFCKSCGHVYETRRLASASLIFGCMPPLLIAMSVGIEIGYYRTSIMDGIFAGLFAALFVWIVIDWIVGVYVRFRYADRAREFQVNRVCPECRSRGAATGGTLPCPECHQRTMNVRAVGMS